MTPFSGQICPMNRLLFLGLLVLTPHARATETDPLKRVAAELSAGIRKQGKVQVAVLALPHHDDRESDGPFMVSEKLAGFLAAEKNFPVVERHHIVQVLEELHLSETGVLDPSSAKIIGDTLGAAIIVTGTLINLPHGECEVNARALRSDTGLVVAASRTIVQQTWASKRSLAQ